MIPETIKLCPSDADNSCIPVADILTKIALIPDEYRKSAVLAIYDYAPVRAKLEWERHETEAEALERQDKSARFSRYLIEIKEAAEREQFAVLKAKYERTTPFTVAPRADADDMYRRKP